MKHRVRKCVQQVRLLRFTGKLIKQITVVSKSQLLIKKKKYFNFFSLSIL